MTDTIETAPYEILLRYTCEIGENIGQLRGCHQLMASYVVDKDGVITGKIDTGETAKTFPVEELQKHLGDQFVTFSGQLEEARSAVAQHKAELDEVRTALAEKQIALDKATAALSENALDVAPVAEK